MAADRDVHVSVEEFDKLYESIKTWGLWGTDDERGALNYITPTQVTAAAALVRDGTSVSLALPLNTLTGPDNPKPVAHFMTMLPDVAVDSGSLRLALDYIGMEFHGDAHSHIDALCHVLYNGTMYNGMPASEIRSNGTSKQSIDVAAAGIVTRGVLLDIPRLRGVPWLEPGEYVFTEDLLAAEDAQGVHLRQGDVLYLRTGHHRRRLELGAWDASVAKAGLHCTAMPLLHDRQIAAFGADGDGDTVPNQCDAAIYPIHVLGMNAIGLHFMDSLQFEDLAVACEQRQRWDFLTVIAPLRLDKGTGSPVNPVAVF
jgi:kynurenine formamidase